MKTHHKIIAFLTIVLLVSCLSPWDGDSGNLTIYWGDARGGRAWEVTPLGDLWKSFSYTVTIKGPGTTVEETFANGVPGATFKLPVGTWGVTIKGRKTIGPPVGDSEYFIMGIEQIEVKPGKKTAAQVTMYNAYEVTKWADLNQGTTPPWIFLPASRPLMFLIANDLKADTSDLPPDYNYTPLMSRDCLLVAEKDVTIGRANTDEQGSFLNVGSGGNVTLGKPGMGGTITFDNEGVVVISAGLITIEDGCSLEMNDGVTIKGGNFKGSACGAVYMNSSSNGPVSFTMNGGTITGNHINSPITHPWHGGGVYVSHNKSPPNEHFNWNGGNIYGNTPDDVYYVE